MTSVKALPEWEGQSLISVDLHLARHGDDSKSHRKPRKDTGGNSTSLWAVG